MKPIIKRYEQPKVDLYDDKGEFVGVVNNHTELMMVIIQLVENNLTGYYIMWGDKQIRISDDGNLSEFPRGLYDELQHLLAVLFRIKKNK